MTAPATVVIVMSKTVSQEEIVSNPQSDVPSLGLGDKAGKPNDDIKYIETIASSPDVGWGQLIVSDSLLAISDGCTRSTSQRTNRIG